MKKIVIALMVLCLSFPILAQSKKELKYEIYSLKKQVTEIQALKAELDALKEENQNLKTEIKNLNFSKKNNVSSSSESGDKIINTDEVQPNAKGQCQATTQAGTQCKRLASEGSNYCWQHQSSDTKQKSSGSTYKSSSSGSSSGSGRTIQTGSRGGKYYINKNGNKTYIKR